MTPFHRGDILQGIIAENAIKGGYSVVAAFCGVPTKDRLREELKRLFGAM
jgi:hypothetical protein